MIWEPFLLALVLGIIVSAGLYFAYLWPSVEPVEPPEPAQPSAAIDDKATGTGPAQPASAASDDAVSSAP